MLERKYAFDLLTKLSTCQPPSQAQLAQAKTLSALADRELFANSISESWGAWPRSPYEYLWSELEVGVSRLDYAHVISKKTGNIAHIKARSKHLYNKLIEKSDSLGR